MAAKPKGVQSFLLGDSLADKVKREQLQSRKDTVPDKKHELFVATL